ncbi:MAG: hypothetical protein PHP03_00195 [Candidatus Pacebacteria bacterium]|nr:hypothetical protein [Candidatus Paceibacterota bacterium]
MIKNFKKREGQVIVESIIAITIALVGVLSVFTLLNKSLSSNVFVADQYIASNLAAEGIEIIKNLIDSNVKQGLAWNTGIGIGNFKIDYNDKVLTDYDPASHEKLKMDSATGIYSYGGDTETKYERNISISQNKVGDSEGNDEIVVTSTVLWSGQGGSEFDVRLEDHFFNWR